MAIHSSHIPNLLKGTRKRLHVEKNCGVPFEAHDNGISALAGTPAFERELLLHYGRCAYSKVSSRCNCKQYYPIEKCTDCFLNGRGYRKRNAHCLIIYQLR